MPVPPIARLSIAVFAWCAAFGPHAAAQSGAEAEVLSPLVATPLASPSPVRGADGKMHLVYELLLVNMAPSRVTLETVETLDAANGAAIGTLRGEALSQMLKLNGGGGGAALAGGGSGILFMDVTLAADAAVPKALKHRFEISVDRAPARESGADADPAPEPPQDISFVGDPLAVGPEAVAVAPPLKGRRWVIGGGCCAPPSYHRGATLPINGAIRIAERFAIDFVQLNDENMLYAGDMHAVTDYAYFGDAIYAVADGTVVATEDGLPEQVPGKLPDDATLATAGGNHVVVDIGGGRYAFYAHMQPGSLRVKAGDTVRTGQVLGRLGNSGNTDTPHLHFHVMDGPSPLLANGLPYVFTAFTGEVRIVDEEPLFKGGKVEIDEDALAGPHADALPLLDQVVSFP